MPSAREGGTLASGPASDHRYFPLFASLLALKQTHILLPTLNLMTTGELRMVAAPVCCTQIDAKVAP